MSRTGVINCVEGNTKEEEVWDKAVLKSPTLTLTAWTADHIQNLVLGRFGVEAIQ